MTTEVREGLILLYGGFAKTFFKKSPSHAFSVFSLREMSRLQSLIETVSKSSVEGNK